MKPINFTFTGLIFENHCVISDSTRRLYEKKLQRLLEAAVHSEASSVKTTPAPKPAPIRRSEPVRYVAPPPPPAEAEFSDPDGKNYQMNY